MAIKLWKNEFVESQHNSQYQKFLFSRFDLVVLISKKFAFRAVSVEERNDWLDAFKIANAFAVSAETMLNQLTQKAGVVRNFLSDFILCWQHYLFWWQFIFELILTQNLIILQRWNVPEIFKHLNNSSWISQIFKNIYFDGKFGEKIWSRLVVDTVVDVHVSFE